MKSTAIVTRRWLPAAILLAAGLLTRTAGATTTVMLPVSGSDGVFDTVMTNGVVVYQGKDLGNGNYTGVMYFERPPGVTFTPGATLYAEVDFEDLGGPGKFGMQYDAIGDDYRAAGFALGSGVKSTGAKRTAVFRLDHADLHGAENGGTDLRLTQPGPLELHILEVRVADQPTALYDQLASFLGPYVGPRYAGGTAVDAGTFQGKLVCGYQGWFRAPGDDDDTGWQHYIADWGGMIAPAKIAVDYWPEMTELGGSERHAADGFSDPDGTPSTLFSSDDGRTVLRHFQWMEAYGIDGVAVQRFLPAGSPDIATSRVLSDVRAAANLTGRTFYVEYDMSGAAEADLVPTITADWSFLKDTMQLDGDERYLHEGGLPVVGIFGFYEERFSAATANAILDIFDKSGARPAYVAGAGAWYWNQQPYSDAWKSAMYRMGAYQPWNTGNSGGKVGDVPSTAYWAADRAALAAHGVLYQPQVYPGGSDFNRSGKAWGPSTEDRLSGAFLWSQMAAATKLGASSVFLGMFDEMDEGTQIFKVSQTPPSQAHFRDYQGLPSDSYLCFTGQGTRMLRGEIPMTDTVPDCASMTQPTIPDPISPLTGATVGGAAVSYHYTPALALAGGGDIDHYELYVDGVITPVNGEIQLLDTAPGPHVWRVRAKSSLGNYGGWSVAQSFQVESCAGAGGCKNGSGGTGGDSGSGGGSGEGGGGTHATGGFGGSAMGGAGGEGGAPGKGGAMSVGGALAGGGAGRGGSMSMAGSGGSGTIDADSSDSASGCGCRTSNRPIGVPWWAAWLTFGLTRRATRRRRVDECY